MDSFRIDCYAEGGREEEGQIPKTNDKVLKSR